MERERERERERDFIGLYKDNLQKVAKSHGHNDQDFSIVIEAL